MILVHCKYSDLLLIIINIIYYANHTFKFNKFPVLEGMKEMLTFLERSSAIACAASSFLIYICVPPNLLTESLISFAASASAYDRII